MDGNDDGARTVIATSIRIGAAFVLTAGMAITTGAQGRRGGPPPGPPRTGTVERVTVRDREVVVYLPPSYAGDVMRRFPAVYLLTERPIDTLRVPEAANKLSSAPGFSEPIVVLADTSAATGDAEKFVAEDLVSFVDGRYRTMPARISRGLGGQLAGGNSALRIAMKRPELFSSLYLMSASVADAPTISLQRYYAIAIDVGTGDAQLAANRQLHEALTRSGIPHYYEEYDGAFTDTAGIRIETRVLPFFSRYLAAPANPTSPAVQ